MKKKKKKSKKRKKRLNKVKLSENYQKIYKK